MIGLLLRLLANRNGPPLSIGRVIRGGGAGDFWLGLVMYMAGFGLVVNRFLTTFTVGGFVNWVLYFFTFAGIVRMISSTDAVLESSRGRRYGAHGDALPPVPMSFVMPPSEMPPGMCWQCGASVRPDRLICMQCGASLPAAAPQPSQTAQLSGFDADASSNALPRPARPVAGPPPGRGVAPGPYQAGAPGRGMPSGGLPPGMMPPGRGMPPGGPMPGWDPRMAGRPPDVGYGRGPRPRGRRRPSFMPQTVRETVEDLRDQAEALREKAEGLFRPFFGQRGRPEAGRGRGPKGYGYGPPGYGPPGYGPPGYGPPGYSPRGARPRGYGPREAAPPGYGPRGGAPRGRGPREPQWEPDDDDYSASDDWGRPPRRGKY
jgi:hypothetical protein